MAKIKTRVTLRTPQAAALIKAASNEALTDMGLQALQDASKHVPHDQGDLEGSGLDNSDKKPQAVNIRCVGILHMRSIFGMEM